MTEFFFYHLEGQRLEAVLPPLLEKSLERGWRVIVQGASVDLPRRRFPAPRNVAGGRHRAPPAGAAHGRGRKPQRGPCPLPDRRGAGAGRPRSLRTHRAAVRRRGRGGGEFRARRVAGRPRPRLPGRLLAARRGRTLGQEGMNGNGPKADRPLTVSVVLRTREPCPMPR